MPQFCDVALPVPLDMVFTYRVAAEAHLPATQQTLTQQEGTLSDESEATGPVVGGRVLVPFRQQRMTLRLPVRDIAPIPCDRDGTHTET